MLNLKTYEIIINIHTGELHGIQINEAIAIFDLKIQLLRRKRHIRLKSTFLYLYCNILDCQLGGNRTQDYLNYLIQVSSQPYDLRCNFDNRSRSLIDQKDNEIKHSSNEWDNGRRSNNKQKDNHNTRLNSRTLGWNVETIDIPESIDCSSSKAHQDNVDKSTITQSNDLPSTTFTTQSSKISSIPMNSKRSDDVTPLINISLKVPSCDTDQTNINRSTSILNAFKSIKNFHNKISQSNANKSTAAQSNDLLSTTAIRGSVSIVFETNNVLPLLTNDELKEIPLTLTSTENKSRDKVLTPLVNNGFVDSEKLNNTKTKTSAISAVLSNAERNDLSGITDNNECYPTLSSDKAASYSSTNIKSVKLSAELNSSETKSNDVSLSSTVTEFMDVSETSSNDEYSSKSTDDKIDNHLTVNVQCISEKGTSPSINSAEDTRNFDMQIKQSHKLNRKRSIDSSATKSSDKNSDTAVNVTQLPDTVEVPVKKSMYSTFTSAMKTKKSNQSKKSAITIKHKQEQNNMIVKLIAPMISIDSNRNRINNECDLTVTKTSAPINLHMKQVSYVNNNKVNESKESKVNVYCKEIDKKPKKSVADKKESTFDKPNTFKKNHFEQFKFILKIMKAISYHWTLANGNIKNVCNAMYHFEKQYDKICTLVEIKYFDDTSNKINFKNFFGDEFNIQRYFNTFCKLKHSCFSNQYSKIVILTNCEIDISLFNNNGIKVFCDNDKYEFEVDSPHEESKIYKKCMESFDLPKLARLLYEFICDSHKLPHFNMKLIRKYHLALVNENVLQMYDEIQKEERVRFAKFHPHFIQDIQLSNAARQLRNHLKKLIRGFPINSMKFRVVNKDFGDDVASERFPETVNKLPDENCKETFEHFFKVFEIRKIIRLTNEEIKCELGEKFIKLETQTYFDAVQKEFTRFLNKHGLKSDIFEALEHTISKLEVTEKISQRPSRHIEFQFDQEIFAIFSSTIIMKNVILYSTESLLFSDLKMRQFSKYLKYTENRESLFITSEILFQMPDDVVNAFSHRSTNLLVITWENNDVTDSRQIKQIEDVIERLRKVSKKSREKKKSIIIADKGNISLSLLGSRIFRIDEDWTLKSQNNCFKWIKVFLQERSMQLSDIGDNAAINNLIKNPKILEKLLAENVKIGIPLAKPVDFKEKFFEFKLKQSVIVNPQIFRENINDVFVISNIDRKNFYFKYKPSDRAIYLKNLQLKNTDLSLNSKYILLESNVNPMLICKKIEKTNVHVLTYQSNNFIWKSTSGSLAVIMKYKIISDSNDYVSFTVKDILINGPRTVIISGEPGIGKSACLYDFANQANEMFGPVWIIQVDLNQPLKNTLRGCSIETIENAIHFLADYLDLKDEQRELFIMGAQGQLKIKIMLFIDGYDDVYENVNLLTSLLQHLQNSNIERMFVTSRTNQLENTLKTFSYSLVFGNEEKCQFVKKFCDHKNFEYNLDDKTKLFTTPLHLKMFMELYHEKPIKISIENHYDLYKNYVNLYLSWNNLKSAYTFSAQKLLRKNELQEIGATIENVNFELPVKLSRKTIIEYFTAKWLTRRYLNSKQCIENLIERTSSIFLSSYLVSYEKKKKQQISIDEFAKYGFLRSLKAILELDSTKKPCLNRLISKGKNKTYEVLKFLLDFFNDTGCHEFIQYEKHSNYNLLKYVNKQINGQTPLQTAAKYNRIDLACELIFKGADISVIQQLSSFIKSMAIYVTQELTNGNIRLGPLVAVLLEMSPQITVDLDVKIQFPKVLSYLFSCGNVTLIEQLLKTQNDHERYKLLETKVDGKSLLDQVNENENIEDENRLQLITYLVNNTSTNLLSTTNIDSILRSACNYGHEHTFNYYISYTKTSINILHEALRSNDEKIINFLMRDNKRTRDANGNNALHQAISLGISRKTLNYLLGKVSINDVNNVGDTVLHIAFKEGASLSTIKFLVNAGASLTSTNDLGFYPWVFAIKEESSRYCKQQQRELMTYLYTKNIHFPTSQSPNLAFDMAKKEITPKLDYFKNADNYDIDYNDNNESRLHIALLCRYQNNWCKFLINHGADVNIFKNGKSAFHLALEYECYDVAKLMLQHGAIIDKIDKTGMTPLDCLKHHANDLPCQSMKEILMLASNIFHSGNVLSKAVHFVDINKIDTCYLRYLLNCRDKKGRTLLHVAACTGDADVIDKLYILSMNCQFRYKDFRPMDVNAIDNLGNTPLHLAAKKNEKCVAKLLSIGACFRMTNLDGKKPIDLSCSGTPIRKWLRAAEDLFKFIKQQKVDDVCKLLKTYPEVQNGVDNSGKTLLHLVKDNKLTRLLLTNRYVNVNALDNEQRPPIYYAAERNYIDGVKLLLKAGASYDFKGFRNRNNESFKLLQKIDELFDDVQSHKPRFFLNGYHWILDEELEDIANTFQVTRDVIINVKDSQKSSLLHYTAKYDYVDATERLLKNGAIYNSRNKYGNTPLDLAVNSKQLFKSIDNLFKNIYAYTWTDVDPIVAVNCRISGGFTLLHKAVEAGNSEMVKWLVDQGADINATTNNTLGVRHMKLVELLNR
ncbi:uncharacterized protein LOC131666629 [Phymastichus coffea]|uniref:uncharacterized protein LOC131666629 n=1 Tax=Phymastichus coffea TaxID=108790 RepID=UPI00273B98D1|nr:uncharacterized protein LOC131666629 [Phymastichus coffea]